MASSTPSQQATELGNNLLPTITLAPPPGLVPSRSLHVDRLAIIPLVISCVICIVTSLELIKLWQREDKFYVEEVYEDSSEGEEETGELPVPKLTPRAARVPVHRGRPDTPESLRAARAEQLQRGISRPFNLQTSMPYEMSDPAWNRGRNPQSGPTNHTRPVPPALHIVVPPRYDHASVHHSAPTSSPASHAFPLPQSTPTTGSVAPNSAGASTFKSLESWEREGSGFSSPSGSPNIGNVHLPGHSPARDDHGPTSGLPNPDTNNGNNLLSNFAWSSNPNAESESESVAAAPYAAYRQSRIDGNENEEESVVSSGLSVMGSWFDRGSYVDRYGDY